MYSFDSKKESLRMIESLKKWFEINGNGCNAVIGISGGKDSSVVAALCVAALGKERVIGVTMPNGKQHDIDVSNELCEFLGIKKIEININGAFESIKSEMKKSGIDIKEQTTINLAPRLRMTTLYAVSQSHNGRVMNTSNLSEDWCGYATRYGDSVGDYSPLSLLTCTEVKAIGKALGLPDKFVEKVPSDGLWGITDEEKFGFTYNDLDTYIRTGICNSESTLNNIMFKHEGNWFKMMPMPMYLPDYSNMYSDDTDKTCIPTFMDFRVK